MEELLEKIFSPGAFTLLGQYAFTFCRNVIIAILVYCIGRWLISRVRAVLARVLLKRDADPSVQTFLQSLVSVVLHFLLIIACVSILGIETSSFVALFASAGVAVGMALSGMLQNFAGGVIILLFKPYKVGDYIEAAGYAGNVKAIQIFNTILTTTDNQTIIIPNGSLSTSSMKNYSTEPYRRVDLKFQFAYGTDWEEVRQAIADVQMACPLIIKEPIDDPTQPHIDIKSVAAPFVRLISLDESGCSAQTRQWCRNADYWAVYFYMQETVYQTLKDRGFMFPFNRMDVTILNQ